MEIQMFEQEPRPRSSELLDETKPKPEWMIIDQRKGEIRFRVEDMKEPFVWRYADQLDFQRFEAIAMRRRARGEKICIGIVYPEQNAKE